jgi:8-oxo-dGTP diphosphatase
VNDATPFFRVVCAAIRHPERHDCFLVAQRGIDDPYLAGRWEFPGGKIEPGESETEALVREIEEELELQIDVGEALKPCLWEYSHVRVELLPFICETRETSVTINDHQSVEWIELERFKALDWVPADVPIYQQLIEILETT